MPTSTPRQITPIVAAFCRALNSDAVPLFIPVTPSPADEVDDCFFNVQRHVDVHGSLLAYGWAVRIWEGVYIEAEHHGVWQRHGGMLVDVTLAADHEPKRLFVRDDAMTYDFAHRRRRDNVRHALVSDPLVDQFLAAAAAVQAFLEQHSAGDTITINKEKLRPFAQRQTMLQ